MRFVYFELQISEALSAALTSDSEPSDSIVAHILFLENFLREKSYWKWPLGVKMSVLGCLMLQSIFQYPHVCNTHKSIKYVAMLLNSLCMTLPFQVYNIYPVQQSYA